MLPYAIAAISLHLASAMYAMNDGFIETPSSIVIIYSTLDVAITLIAVKLAVGRSGLSLRNRLSETGYFYSQAIGSRIVLVSALTAWAIYLASESFHLISAGGTRQELLSQYDQGGFGYMMVSGTFKLLTPIVLVFSSPMKIKAVVLCGLAATLVITASRSELGYVLMSIFVLTVFSRTGSKVRSIFGFVSILIFVLIAASLSTVFLQGRSSSAGMSAILDVVDAFIRYRSYGFHLAELSMEASKAVEKVFFPFFGYPSEYLLRTTFSLRTPIDSSFVGDLHYLGAHPATGKLYLANVLYPWWSWFVGPFGPAGLIIKGIFYFFVLSSAIRNNFLLVALVLLTYGMIGSAAAHPLLTLTHTISFAIPLVLDIYIRRLRRKFTN